MKAILPVFVLIIIYSFTFNSPKDKTTYQSPDLDKLMVYVPPMAFNYSEEDYLMRDYPLELRNTYSMKEFYMFPYEVSNGQYLEYLNDLKAKNDTSLNKSLPDTLVWRDKLAYNEPYVDYYLRHPAYANYPIVGITHKQCIKYCEWLTEKYNSTEKRKHKKVKFRLPTKYEWYAAAVYRKAEKGKSKNIKDVSIYDDSFFPWDGTYLRNDDGKPRANFLQIDETSIHREYDSVTSIFGRKSVRQRYVGEPGFSMGVAGTLNDASDITAPVDSYWPNDLGIYNMAGNVEEFVSEYGITKGGSWHDPGYYLRNTVIETYQEINEATSSRGFRFVMEVIEE